MVRAQILLKEQQYEALKTRARREGKSLSDVARTAIATWLGQKPTGSAGARLGDICGIFTDPGGPPARQHDRVLYGRR